MKRSLARLLPLFVLIVGSWSAAAPGAAFAQEASGWTVSGTVRSGTQGAELPDGLPVELITLGAGLEAAAQQTVTAGGRFEFAVPAVASLTHVLRTVYGGVQYFAADPVQLTAEQPAAEREIVVYETTGEAPPLRIESTAMTAVALDRVTAQITLVREDTVVNDGDRTFTGDDRGITLRLPVPDDVIEADGSVMQVLGLPELASFELAGGRLAVSAPLRPGPTLVVTRYVVGYDRDRDAYSMRVAAPLPAGRMELRVPARFADAMRPLGGAERGDDIELEGERVLVFGLDGEAAAGDSAAVELRGLMGRSSPNPLTERGGAIAGTALALLTLVGGFALVRRLSAEGPAGGGATDGDAP